MKKCSCCKCNKENLEFMKDKKEMKTCRQCRTMKRKTVTRSLTVHFDEDFHIHDEVSKPTQPIYHIYTSDDRDWQEIETRV